MVSEPATSRVEFQAVDEEATNEKRRMAEDSVPPVYMANRPYLTQLKEQFDGLMAFADYQSVDEIPSDYRKQVQLTTEGLRELQRYKRADSGKTMQQWQELTGDFLRDLFNLAIMRDPPNHVRRVVLLHPTPGPDGQRELERNASVLYSLDDPAIAEALRRDATAFPPPLRQTVLAMVINSLEPTYVFNQQAQKLTEQRRQEAYQSVEPVMETHNADEVLIPAGKQITEADLELLAAERDAFQAQRTELDRWLPRVGLIGMMIILAVGLWAYVFHYNQKIARNPMRGMALTALLLICQGLAVGLTRVYPQTLYMTALLPTLLIAIVMIIAYDQRFALAIGALHTAIVMVSLGLPVGFALVLTAGVGTAAMLLGDVRNRSTVVLIGLWSGLAMAGATLLVGFAEQPLHLDGQMQRIFLHAAMAAVTGVFTGLLVQGTLPAIEKVFNVNTAMTLKELNDASHPLLQRLAQEAPGTYQHSLRIADMAESAADSIGADGLLCRVGAMYHDIGKINKPAYFIENQAGGPNRHAKLSPAMSLLIIVGHVKDGIEMAREYRLPPSIRHFIESHHGTTLVEYFYHAARKQKEAEAAPGPSEFEFRYAGPKPQSKEAAIMLLCDSVEAAARSLAEPTPVRLEQIVHNIAMKRLMDDQFDESALTLKELNRIEAAITKTLCAIYHARIKYPEQGAQATSTATQPPPDRPRIQPAAS